MFEVERLQSGEALQGWYELPYLVALRREHPQIGEEAHVDGQRLQAISRKIELLKRAERRQGLRQNRQAAVLQVENPEALGPGLHPLGGQGEVRRGTAQQREGSDVAQVAAVEAGADVFLEPARHARRLRPAQNPDGEKPGAPTHGKVCPGEALRQKDLVDRGAEPYREGTPGDPGGGLGRGLRQNLGCLSGLPGDLEHGQGGSRLDPCRGRLRLPFCVHRL